MKVNGLDLLRRFLDEHCRDLAICAALQSWLCEARAANWASFKDIETRFQLATRINPNRVIFAFPNGDCRLLVQISFACAVVLVLFVGTSREFEAIQAEES